MKKVPVFTGLILAIGGSIPALGDVDTLECNTAAAIRVLYGTAHDRVEEPWSTNNRHPQSGAFCLPLNGEEATFDVDGVGFSIRYDSSSSRRDGEELLPLHVGISKTIVLSPSDRSSSVFVVMTMERVSYDPIRDGNWRYTPLWVEVSDPVRIVVGEREGGMEL